MATRADEPRVRLEAFGRGEDDRSFGFSGFRSAVTAREAGDVRRALADVESAVADGLHAAGFVAYEAAAGLEPKAAVKSPAPGGPPLVWFGLFESRQLIRPDDTADGPVDEAPCWTPSLSRERYVDDLAAIRAYIASGDTYQVNHTFRTTATLGADRWAFYRAVCRSQRADYCAFVDTGEHTILSASPELFFSLRDRTLTTRPMKGTHPRGRWPDEDVAFRDRLAASEKDRAENLMIVDLLRNDLGRVSETGSVEVSDLWRVEPYETLFQMTSTVRSRVREQATLVDLFEALFPCGSVTGAPKIRTMEIIDDLEAEPRGVYTGAVGYLSPGPDACFSVAIRTVTVENETGNASFGVGGGITWDSDADGEYAECETKMRVLTERRPDFSLFETVRTDGDAGVFLRDRHLERMARSARYFGFPFHRSRAETLLDEAARSSRESLRVRLVLSPRGGLVTEASPMSPAVPEYTAAISPARVDTGDVFLYHKTTRREAYARALEACDGVDDAILVNERGELTEFTIGNLVVELDGRMLTPPVDSGLLRGTFRDHLVDTGAVEESTLTPGDLQRASNVYMVNSVREWVPVTLVSDPVVAGRALHTPVSAES